MNSFRILQKTLSLLVLTALMHLGGVVAQSIYEPVQVGTLAGSGGNSGSLDGTGAAARLNQPWGIAAGADGRLVVADTLNHTIRTIDANAVVSTLAGVVGVNGYLDGPVATAQFNRPTGVAIDAAGTVYVADYNNHVIRKISGGNVTTLAGTAGVSGIADGAGLSAQFRNPFGLALTVDGSVLYVTDQNNQSIRRIALPSGVVSTYAGVPGQFGSLDGPNTTARFNTPRGIAVDAAGNVFVSDAGNLTVRRIEASGGVSTIAGAVNLFGFTDGPLGTSRFSALQFISPFGGPCGLAVDLAGNVFVCDQGNHALRKISPTGSVTTLAGLAQTSGTADGVGNAAAFFGPSGIALTPAGKLVIADARNHTIRISDSLPATPTDVCRPGDTWTPHESNRKWTATASSEDGGFLVAVAHSDLIYTSTDHGATWVPQPGSGVHPWWAVATSATGQHLLAAENFGQLHVSHDFGVTWSTVESPRTWFAVASSANGVNLSAVASNGQVFTSANSGATWTAHLFQADWRGIAMSSSGVTQVAAIYGGGIYTSTDSGANWTLQPNAGNRNWYTVACSANGTRMAAIDFGGHVYLSQNSGVSWVAVLPNNSWHALAMSADGTQIVVAAYNGMIYMSHDSGANWTPEDSNRNWDGLAMSGNGRTLLAADYEGRLYTSECTTPVVVCRPGDHWSPRDTNRIWTATTSSRSGNLQVAAAYSGLIYTSIDHGITWVPQPTSGVNNWWAVACSATGQDIIAAANSGVLYISHDSGATWTPTESPRSWNAVAMSDNGQSITAVAAGGQVYVSSNSGVSWTPQLSVANWHAAAMSASGQTQVAAASVGALYTSINGGATWTLQSSAGTRSWLNVACSASGVDMAAIDFNGQIYLSHDTGATWSAVQSNNTWHALAMSSDGTQILAAAYNEYLYISHDSGVTWTSVPMQHNWHGVAMSGDGSVLVAADYQGQLYTADCPSALTVTCPTNQTVECGTVWSFTPPTATSTCGTNISIAVSGTVTNGVCPRVITRTWTVSDGCGKTNVCSQSVTLQDTQPPTLSGSTNKLVSCGTSWKFDAPKVTDVCSGTNVVLRITGVVTNLACPVRYTQTWEAVDLCGNVATFSQTVEIVDNDAPMIDCSHLQFTVPLGTNCTLRIPEIHPPATDSCTPADALVYAQDPPAGAVVDGPCRVVTVSVRDRCGNVSRCQVTVCGQDRTPPRLVCPREVKADECLVPDALALVRATDNCTPVRDLVLTQVPAAGSAIAPGVTSVTVTATDAAGNQTVCTIPIHTGGSHSFLDRLFNTGVDASHAVVPAGSVDAHYTLGPVPLTTPTTAGYYHAPDARVATSPWGLPPFTVSRWIRPGLTVQGYPLGEFVYSNRFVLPPGVDLATVAISGRWAADDRAKMFLNGQNHSDLVAAINAPAPAGYTSWTPFSIHSGFLQFPATNTLYFVVSSEETIVGITGLRVEFTEAIANCNGCAPPVVTVQPVSTTRPRFGLATMSVSVSGTQPMTYQWYFNGNALTNGGSVFGADTATLLIAPLQYSNAGNYSVVVSNACGRTRSKAANLKVTHGFPWIWNWWNAEGPLDPLSPVHGTGVIISGPPLVGISRGTCEEFDLPLLGGRSVPVTHVAMLPLDSMIRLPRRSTSTNSNYSLVMDLFAPPSTNGPTVLFQLPHGSKLEGGGLKLWLAMDGRLRVAGTAAKGMMVDFSSSMPLIDGAWNRIALVMSGASDAESQDHLRLYLNGQSVGEMAGTFDVPMDAADSNAETGTLFNTPDGNGAELYVAGVQFHETALTPEMLAALGNPESGELMSMDSSMPMPMPNLVASASNGKFIASWSEGTVKLQETTDPVAGPWMDSDRPFTQSEDALGIRTAVELDPQPNDPVRYFRLVESR